MPDPTPKPERYCFSKPINPRDFNDLRAENERLKAEVERLKAENERLTLAQIDNALGDYEPGDDY